MFGGYAKECTELPTLLRTLLVCLFCLFCRFGFDLFWFVSLCVCFVLCCVHLWFSCFACFDNHDRDMQTPERARCTNMLMWGCPADSYHMLSLLLSRLLRQRQPPLLLLLLLLLLLCYYFCCSIANTTTTTTATSTAAAPQMLLRP